MACHIYFQNIILYCSILYYTVLYYTVEITMKIKLVSTKPKTLIDPMHNRNKKHPKLKGDDHIRISKYKKNFKKYNINLMKMYTTNRLPNQMLYRTLLNTK